MIKVGYKATFCKMPKAVLSNQEKKEFQNRGQPVREMAN